MVLKPMMNAAFVEKLRKSDSIVYSKLFLTQMRKVPPLIDVKWRFSSFYGRALPKSTL